MALYLGEDITVMMEMGNNRRKCIKHQKTVLTEAAPGGNPLSRGQEEHFSCHDRVVVCISLQI